MEEFQIYKKWPKEELFGDLLLQYDLTTALEPIVNIPFQIIEWVGSNALSEIWNEQNTETCIAMTGNIIFEGIRHCNFAEQDEGYMNYPDVLNLSKCLFRLHEMCLTYCHSYL